MHILVVDDDPAYREILRRMLVSTYDVREAEAGELALEAMREEKPSAVLLDLQMPEMDGIQVMVRMQEDPSLASVPVMVISAFDDIEWKVKAIQAGANDYMVKPVAKAELLARVAVQLRRTHESPRLGGAASQTSSHSVEPRSSAAPEYRKNELLDGRYLITGVLGRGGGGTVYEAQQVKLGRSVAIKVIGAGGKLPNRAKRLEREAQIVGSLGHANICQVYDMGRLEDGSPYVVMEKLEGKSLEKHLKDTGALPFADIVPIMDDLLCALHAAHVNDVIHRDVKPANVFLSIDAGGRVRAKVLDFGLAKLVWSSGQTAPDIALGTPVYMAPEQILNYRITPAVDVYGAGVVLFEMVTGQRPFSGKNLNELAIKIKNGLWHDPRALRPDVPDYFVEAIDKARARSADERFGSAEAFRSALRRGERAAERAIRAKATRIPWWRKLV